MTDYAGPERRRGGRPAPSSWNPRAPREACLRGEHAALYPGVTPGEWMRASIMTGEVWRITQYRRNAIAPGSGRLLTDAHFGFRHGGGARGAAPDRGTRVGDQAPT